MFTLQRHNLKGQTKICNSCKHKQGEWNTDHSCKDGVVQETSIW